MQYDNVYQRIKRGEEEYVYDSQDRIVKKSGAEFLYDDAGVSGIKYEGATYMYRRDGQGNIVALIDSSGNVVVKYEYDAWGNHEVYDGSGTKITQGTHVGRVNPYRYRGYYYDEELKLYYLKTRYYDPEVGRFINADDITYIDPETINGLNLYAYCGNNPVMRIDPNGNLFFLLVGLFALAGAVAGGVVAGVNAYEAGYRGWDLVGKIAVGAVTGGVVGGAVGAVLGLGTAAIVGGLSSIAGKFVSDVVASAVSGTWAFGTWEDYAISFVFGGILKGAGKMSKAIIDIIIRPAISQIVKAGTRGGNIDLYNYLWNVMSRAITYNFGFGVLSIPLFGEALTLTLGKSIYRGFFSGLWKKLN